MKLSDLHDGDIVILDDSFTCIAAGEQVVKIGRHCIPFVWCSHGEHYLDGQVGDDGELIGISPRDQS